MNFDEFKGLVEKVKMQDSVVFSTLTELGLIDAPASDEDIARVEAALRVPLPQDYVLFLKEYGGGTFYYVDIYSAQPDSDFYIMRYQPPLKGERDFVAFSENGCGDYYGFRVRSGICEPGVVFWDHEKGGALNPTDYQDFLTYAAIRGLNRSLT